MNKHMKRCVDFRSVVCWEYIDIIDDNKKHKKTHKNTSSTNNNANNNNIANNTSNTHNKNSNV